MSQISPSVPGLLARVALGLAAAGLSVLCLAAPARAQAAPTTAVPFLQIEPDARAVAMGLAGTAAASGPAAQFWNPAALADLDGAAATLTHAPWLAGLDVGLAYEFLAGAYALDGVGTLAGHVTYLNLGEQDRTDAQGQSLGTLRSYELAVGASVGRALSERLAVGGGLRLVQSRLDGGATDAGAATAVAVDLGVRYRLPALAAGRVRPTLALALANAGPALHYTDDGAGDPLPTTLRAGAAVEAQLDRQSRLTVVIDATKLLVDRDSSGAPASFVSALFSSWGPVAVDLDGAAGADGDERIGALRQLTVGTGVEYVFDETLALRTGYFYEDPMNGNRRLLTFGAGFRYNVVGIDLSYIHALGEASPMAGQLYVSLLLNLPR